MPSKRSKTPGLYRDPVTQHWLIDKWVLGRRIRGSTRTGSLKEAQLILARQIEDVRRAVQFGERPRRTWRDAATKYLTENTHIRSIGDAAMHLEQLDRWIGDLEVSQIHDATLRPFVQHRLAAGRRPKTVNLALGVVRRILNLGARSWRDEFGMTWLDTAPLITMLPLTDTAKPYPLDWDEQRRLFRELPAHLARMALFAVNTGLREQEVCGLLWEWERQDAGVFIVPGSTTKNGDDRLVVLNAVARSVVEELRGAHGTHVFTYLGEPVGSMHNTAWKRAWRAAGLPVEPQTLRGVHNLRHTFGRRLRAAGVPLETRQTLLGHRNGHITTHYSAPELAELLAAVEKIAATPDRRPALMMLR